jgi:phosphatidylinositol alpha 1,6-mannosyltransferase
MSKRVFTSYVAIGDSLSEGLGDFSFNSQREHNGWTDRLAALLSQECQSWGVEFRYANLALRGSKLRGIMTEQLEAALRLQPDLVTIMAGSNDLMASDEDLVEFEEIYRNGLQLLLAAEIQVLVANTIRPSHLRVFRGMLPRASRMSQMVERVAREFGIQVIDVHGTDDFSKLAYWAEDMVHFSGHGHINVANQAAELLGLDYRMPEAHESEMISPPRGPIATLRWIVVYVIPFIERRVRGTSSGDGMTSKHQLLVPYGGNAFEKVSVSQGGFARAA